MSIPATTNRSSLHKDIANRIDTAIPFRKGIISKSPENPHPFLRLRGLSIQSNYPLEKSLCTHSPIDMLAIWTTRFSCEIPFLFQLVHTCGF